MIFVKNYFVPTTAETDIIPIIHDIRFAIRDSQMKEGLATISLPEGGACLVAGQTVHRENLPCPQRSLSIPFQNGELLLEPKQMIYLVDQSTTGKRREFFVQIMGEAAPAKQPARPAGRRR